MATETPAKIRLRTIDELSAAHEWLFAMQQSGQIDNKSADALNTTLKGASYLNAKLKIEAAKLFLTARIKKVDFPKGMFPIVME
jgi:hypothetical protein